MKKYQELQQNTAFKDWTFDKSLRHFDTLIENLKQEGLASRADVVCYLIERIKFAEERIKILENEKEEQDEN